MRRKALLAGLLILLPALNTLPAPAQETRDPKAVEIAKAMMQAMGGEEAFNNMRFVRFDFRVGQNDEWRVERSHLWDKWTGRYRLERRLDDGKLAVTLFNVNSKQGDFYLDGEKVEGSAADEVLKTVYRSFINDTYWLAMPWKWLDPGVNLKYADEKEHGGQTCDIVELSFGKVGLTPGDVYQAYVSRDSKLMIHWTYTLQSGAADGWDWEYVDTGGLKLARTHTKADGSEIDMGAVAASSEMDDAYFTDPARTLE
jgi:hypothetical protein